MSKSDKNKYFNVSPETLRALQLKSLEMMVYLRDFCDEHGLSVFFCGGCCIGTLRHGGFIPWDDDIDVFMPREDYERLFELWPEYADTSRYSCLKTTKDKFIGNIFTTIVDNNTTCIKPPQKDLDIPQGIAIDVFPLDGCPIGIKRKMQKLNALIYSLYIAQEIPKNHGPLVTAVGALMLGIVPVRSWRVAIGKAAEKRMSRYKIEDCDFITELCAGPHYMQNEYPKRCFDGVVRKSFEGYEMPLPAGYDEYLHIAFGDYMQPPPKEKQVAHHDFIFLDTENSYKKYKGIKYLTKGKK